MKEIREALRTAKELIEVAIEKVADNDFKSYIIQRYDDDLSYLLEDNPFVSERLGIGNKKIMEKYFDIKSLLNSKPFIMKELEKTPEYNEWKETGKIN